MFDTFDTIGAARRIKRERAWKNASQTDFAEAMGVSYQTVSNWERGSALQDLGGQWIRTIPTTGGIKMFDTMGIAKRIRQTRVEKNMTQMNLADAMGVSYQAVSNWERGNSLPDIGKLEDLCRILELEVSELLGMESKAASAVDKVLKEETLTMEELAEVAPLLPPKQTQEQAEKAANKKKLNFSQIIGLAPFLDEEYLAKLVEESEPENLSEVACIAPFLGKNYLRKLVSRCEGTEDFGTIMSLAPFLDRETLDELADKLVVDDLWQAISLAPFLSREMLDKLVTHCEADADCGALCSLAPFASKQTLDKLVDRLLAKGGIEDMDCITSLAPFLSKETLRKVMDKMMEDRNLDGLTGIAVFL